MQRTKSTMKNGKDPPLKCTFNCGVWAIPKNTACKFFTKYLLLKPFFVLQMVICNIAHKVLLPDSTEFRLCSSIY